MKVKHEHLRFQVNKEEVQLEGYIQFSSKLDRVHGRGILVYVNAQLGPQPVEMGTEFEESQWASVDLKDRDQLLIGCLYRSLSNTDTNNTRLRELLLKALQLKYSHLLLARDFDCRDLNWDTVNTPISETREKYRFIECIRDAFLYQHVTHTPEDELAKLQVNWT